MPGVNFIKQLAYNKFSGFKIKLPSAAVQRGVVIGAHRAPGGMTKAPTVQRATSLPSNFGGARQTGGGNVSPTPPMNCPPALFVSASVGTEDVAEQKAKHEEYKMFIDSLTDAVKYSWDLWKLQAKFVGLKIMGPTAIGTPGCLDGPSLESNIKNAPSVVAWTGAHAQMRDAFAAGLQNSWVEWQRLVTVPGLPWYPAFAAFPGPMAPPMPNVPTPLIACVSAGMSAMATPAKLKQNLTQKLAGKMDFHDQFSDAMAEMIAAAFTLWLPAQMVTQVMGKGPIPTFAPPYVPVGPVVNGDNIAIPGHLAT